MSFSVDVWICTLDRADELASKFSPLLCAKEMNKAKQYAFQHLQDSYVLSRGLTRYILGAQLATAPKAIQFDTQPWGKPFVATNPDLFFNVSHAGSRLAVAVSHVAPVGIDIELIHPMPDALSVAKSFFSDEEIARLAGLSPSAQERAFFECWTRKEAFIKAPGEGLHRDVKRFTVRFGPGQTSCLDWIENDNWDEWTLRAFEAGESYVGAIAMRAGIGELRLHDLTPV